MAGRWIANLLLLLTLIGLGLLIRHDLTMGGQPQILAGVDPADLRLIQVEREGEPLIRLERTSAGWRMQEPMEVDADQEHLDKLLGVLQAPVERSFPEQGAALAQIGLAPPRLKLKLDSLTLGFGGLDPLNQRRYVGADGLVHLIADRFHHLLIAPPVDYVSRAPLPAGRPAAFATLSGVPLGAASLEALAGLRAERVEPLGAELSGEALQVKFSDGSAIRFLVSEDRRRWSRLDQRLRYVMTDPPLLELDPTAIDPTPPEPPPTAPAALPDVQDPTPLPMPAENDGFDGYPYPGELGPDYGVPLEPPDPADPFAPRADPDALVTEGAAGGSLPVIRLRPESYGRDSDEEYDYGRGLGGEPYKDPPEGFGTDPFAPDPAYDPDWSPDEP